METDKPQKQDQSKLAEIEKRFALWDKALDQIGPIIEYFKARLEKHDAPVAKYTIWGLIFLIVLIIGVSTLLVALDKLPDSAFTFIIGTIVGFLLAMAKMFFQGGSE
jgi:hypothetical protein